MIDRIDSHVDGAADLLRKGRYEIFRESDRVYRFIGSGSEELFYLDQKAFMASGTCGSYVMDRSEDAERPENSSFLTCKDCFFVLAFTCGHTQFYDESVAKADVERLLDKLHGKSLEQARALAVNCFASKYDHPRVQLFVQRLKSVLPKSDADLIKPGIGWRLEPGFVLSLAMLRLIVADQEKIFIGESIYRGGDSK
ncbi:MAG: hypothetical protein IJ177_13475 [Fibrobacter sp.]|uniref:hypothetical protein n=1 Tax=Fibrobacter sp. TaxID=35828 RepID=UPI0025C3BB85|nr:hypothetical protein [Fibrobacter sp.]MBQ9227165.1 hypothetical protein [Fibrobacter sp.]